MPTRAAAVRAMFEEQVGWAVDAGVDFIIGETFSWLGEAHLALEIDQERGQPAVITLAMHQERCRARACRWTRRAGACRTPAPTSWA